jgi:hypothetical protein
VRLGLRLPPRAEDEPRPRFVAGVATSWTTPPTSVTGAGPNGSCRRQIRPGYDACEDAGTRVIAPGSARSVPGESLVQPSLVPGQEVGVLDHVRAEQPVAVQVEQPSPRRSGGLKRRSVRVNRFQSPRAGFSLSQEWQATR